MIERKNDGANVKTCIVIPARLRSTRLPEKLLLAETGKLLVQHTYEAASKSKLAQSVFVATDSSEIYDRVRDFGGQAVMTDPSHQSGTDRIAEFATQFPDFELLINLQGDEPEIAPAAIDTAIQRLLADDELHVATLACPVTEIARLSDPSCVKVVVDKNNRALYFSRSNIPFCRDFPTQVTASHLQHIGLYAYRRDFLVTLSQLPLGKLESIEKLEQLRVLEAGFPIGVEIVDEASPGIDTPEDYAAFVRRQQTC